MNRNSAGKVVVVHDLASALTALEEIVEQGEGLASWPEAGAGSRSWSGIEKRRRCRPA